MPCSCSLILSPEPLTPSSPIRPMPPGGAPRRRRTNPPPRSIPAWGTMRPRPLTGTPRTRGPGPAGRQSGSVTPESSASRRPGVYVHRLAPAPRRQRRPPVGRVDLAGNRCLGQGQQPAPERPVPAAGGVHCLGLQRRYAHQPPSALSPRCVQVRQSPEPHPPDGEAPPAHAGHREDHRAGGHILDPFAGSGTTVLAAMLEGYTATGIEVTDEYAMLARERIARELEPCA